MKTYTNEEMAAMNAEQLKAAIVELQGQTADSTVLVTADAIQATVTAHDATQATEDKTSVQTDIEKIEAHIADLKADGEELYADAITALEAKRDALVAEAETAAEVLKTDVGNITTGLVTIEQTFAQKYGQAIAHGAEIVLLGYIAGRLAGVI